MQFNELNLITPLLRAVEAAGYATPTPIQQQAIPPVLEGRDLIGCAQTGTGKTAAFALPIIQRLYADTPKQGKRVRALVLSPTRELAAQIGESFQTYGRHTRINQTTIFGGVNQSPQVNALRRGVDVLIATPGRLLDLMTQGHVSLEHVEIFVLDEADRMLDMGFINDVRRIIAKLPAQRQNLLFSATMPPEIVELANSFLKQPAYVEVTPPASTVDRIAQSVYFVEKNEKHALLRHLLRDKTVTRALIFTRTKHGADKVVRNLQRDGIRAAAIHGDKSQGARMKALDDFKSGYSRVLVATDIAARGIDIDDISHVINYELPEVAETYVHRIGRTARAGADGVALSFCQEDEREYLIDIERTIRKHIDVVGNHPYESPLGIPPRTDLNKKPVGAANRKRHNREAERNGTAASGGQRPRRSGGGSGYTNPRDKFKPHHQQRRQQPGKKTPMA